MQRANSFIKYVYFAGQGGCSRAEAATEFNVHKTTAIYNLEMGVKSGDLEKWWGYVDDNQCGWLYRQVGSNLELPFEVGAESFEEHARDLELGTW